MNFYELIRKYRIRPKKSLGQNFLLDRRALRKVVQAANLQGHETVLEIGAGLGSLTTMLSDQAARVLAVEVDAALLPALQEAVGDRSNVEIVLGDIMDLDLSQIIESDEFCVVANIPYNITSNLIRRLLESSSPPEFLVLTIQKEVAERIVAEPGDMSLLALGVQVYGLPEIKARIRSGSFYPRPKVDSAVLRVDFPARQAVPERLAQVIFRLAGAAFQQKRKQLPNSLSSGLGMEKQMVVEWLKKAGIPPRKRPQALGVPEWVRLARVFQMGWDLTAEPSSGEIDPGESESGV